MVELTRQKYDSLIYRLATLEDELKHTQKLLEAPPKRSLWRRLWGATALMIVVVVVVGTIQAGAGKSGGNYGIGIFTGNQYRHFSDAQRIIYAAGLHDGIGLAPLFGAPDEKWTWAINFMEGMRTDQLMAIFDKYLNDHPERWHEPMNLLGYSALVVSCRK